MKKELVTDSDKNLLALIGEIVGAITKVDDNLKMLLLRLAGNTHEKIAKEFNLSHTAVTMKINRAIRTLRKEAGKHVPALKKQHALEEESALLKARISFLEKIMTEKGLLISEEDLARGIAKEVFLKTPIPKADLSVETRNRLLFQEDLETMSDVMAFHQKSHLIKIKGFGKKMLEEVRALAKKNGIEMK